MRARFEENRKVKDMAKAAHLLAAGEQELFNTQHYQPIKCKLCLELVYSIFILLMCFNIYKHIVANSPGGCAFERDVEPPDWVLDYWHPLEKAQYPEFFAKREQRKKEFVAWWEKQYGKPDPKDLHH